MGRMKELAMERDFFTYPLAPGFKVDGTSRAAANAMKWKAGSIKALALDALAKRPMTADEIAVTLCRSILAVRPRMTELNKLGEIVDTWTTRPNESGLQAIVWMLK